METLNPPQPRTLADYKDRIEAAMDGLSQLTESFNPASVELLRHLPAVLMKLSENNASV